MLTIYESFLTEVNKVKDDFVEKAEKEKPSLSKGSQEYLDSVEEALNDLLEFWKKQHEGNV